VKALYLFKMYLNAFLLEFVMLYSKTFYLRLDLPQLQTILLTGLLLVCPPNLAQTNGLGLIDGDMGLPSSEADNSLIDTDTIAPTVPEPKLSPAEAAELVRNKVGGQVMSVNIQQNDTGVTYGVKVLNAGRMRIINVDGQTGQLLNH
jgi:hypothetical protein